MTWRDLIQEGVLTHSHQVNIFAAPPERNFRPSCNKEVHFIVLGVTCFLGLMGMGCFKGNGVPDGQTRILYAKDMQKFMQAARTVSSIKHCCDGDV